MLTKNRRFFLLITSYYLSAIVLFLLLFPKGTESLYCYKNQTESLSYIFQLITEMGEWIGIVLLSIFLLVKDRKAFLSALIGFLPMDLLMIYTKKILDYPRPLLYFQHHEITPISFITPLYHQSMPSGHTFTAFFIASFICFFFNLSLRYQIAMMSLAILVGISRVYLLCHFMEDILLGSIMGIVAGIIPSFAYSRMTKHVA